MYKGKKDNAVREKCSLVFSNVRGISQDPLHTDELTKNDNDDASHESADES